MFGNSCHRMHAHVRVHTHARMHARACGCIWCHCRPVRGQTDGLRDRRAALVGKLHQHAAPDSCPSYWHAQARAREEWHFRRQGNTYLWQCARSRFGPTISPPEYAVTSGPVIAPTQLRGMPSLVGASCLWHASAQRENKTHCVCRQVCRHLCRHMQKLDMCTHAGNMCAHT